MQLSATDISLIANVNAAFAMSMGLFSGALLRRFTYRKVSLAAGILFVSGLFATAFSTTFVEFMLFYGLVTCKNYILVVLNFDI